MAVVATTASSVHDCKVYANLDVFFISIHSTLCFSSIPSQTNSYNRSKRQFPPLLLLFPRVMLSLKKSKSISKQIIFILKLILVRTHRICTKIGFLVSHQLLCLRYCCYSAVSAADLLEFQDDCSFTFEYYRFRCSCLSLIRAFWCWSVNLTKH